MSANASLVRNSANPWFLANLGGATLSAEGGTFSMDPGSAGTLNNFGSVSLSGGNLLLGSGPGGTNFSQQGQLSIAAGHTLTMTGGFFNQSGTNPSGHGRLVFMNTSMQLCPGGMSTNGLGIDFTGAGLSAFGFGTLTVQPGDTLVTDGFNLGTPVTNQGLWIARGTTDATPSVFTSSAGSRLRIEAAGAAAQFYVLGLTNNGVIELTSSGSAILASAKLATLQTGIFKIINSPGDSIIGLQGVGGDRVVDGKIDNRGVISSQMGFDTGSIGTWNFKLNGALSTRCTTRAAWLSPGRPACGSYTGDSGISLARSARGWARRDLTWGTSASSARTPPHGCWTPILRPTASS